MSRRQGTPPPLLSQGFDDGAGTRVGNHQGCTGHLQSKVQMVQSAINWVSTETTNVYDWCNWHILMISDIMASSSKLGFRSNDLARINKE